MKYALMPIWKVFGWYNRPCNVPVLMSITLRMQHQVINEGERESVRQSSSSPTRPFSTLLLKASTITLHIHTSCMGLFFHVMM